MNGIQSAPVPVERGVAQGCPLSPLLYDIFADTLLDAVQSDTSDEGVPVPAAGNLGPRHLVGQSYADDMAGIATSAAGLQRVIDRVRAHSAEWEWEANTKKSTTMVFGPPDILQAEQHSQWHWGDTQLNRVQTMKYLGLHFHESGSWAAHIDMAATKGHHALRQWLPVLLNSALPVSLKRKVITSRIVPVLTYGIEVWSPEQCVGRCAASLSPLSDVIEKACRIAAGLHATPNAKAWQKRACVSKEVLQSDFQQLPLSIQLDLAHARYGIRSQLNDDRALQQQVPPPIGDAADSMSAFRAPDQMGALLRAQLQPTDPWLMRSQRLRPNQGTAAATQPVLNAARSAASVQRLRSAVATPVHCATTRSGRVRRTTRDPDPHVNPVTDVLQQQVTAGYLRGPSPAVWPIMSLRSARLPYTFGAATQRALLGDECQACGANVISLEAQLTDVERRWRHMRHQLFSCATRLTARVVAPLQALLRDARAEALRRDCAELASKLFNDAEYYDADCTPDLAHMHDAVVPLLLDPVAHCRQFSSCAPLAANIQRLVAAFCLQAGAVVAGVDVDRNHLLSLGLPKDSCLHLRVFPEDYCPPSPAPDSSTDSDDELVPPWVQQPVMAALQAPSPVPTTVHVPDDPPSGQNLPHVFPQSGPRGLHEADAFRSRA